MNQVSVGDRAPDFTLIDQSGEKVKLSNFKGQRVILYFYPAAMTPGCTKQACDFTDNVNIFKGAGYAIVGISPDSPEKLNQFTELESIAFTLLSDPTKETMAAYGAFGEKKLYGKTVTGVIRSTFVINEKGVIEQAFRNVKATGHVAKMMRELALTSNK